MKRAKFLLSAVAVLAIVGGALAFKANNKFSTTYCILTTLNKPSGGQCTGEIALSKFATATPAVTFWYTTKGDNPTCPGIDCLSSSSFTKE